MKQLVTIAGRELQVTNLDKVFWPAEGYTKGDLINYYVRVAPYLLAHLEDRPLVFTRYPDGIDGEWFYQKDLPDYAPEWIESFSYYSRDSDRALEFCLSRNEATLAWIANQAVIEIHPWMSRYDRPDYPDFAIFDLDPAAPATFDQAREVAFLVKPLLEGLGLAGYPKTSGATGLHIYVPIRREFPYRVVCGFVEKAARLIASLRPEWITLERTVSKRTGKVYIDYLQNLRGKTIVAPYSVRPFPGAPVSTPITWEELERVQAEVFTIRTIIDRLAVVGDLFAPVLGGTYSLKEPLERLG